MARAPRLSRSAVVTAALAFVDQAGADGLTMRALARQLGVDPMALYRHVRDKEDLLGAMCDVAIGELPPLDLAEPWEPQVRALARGLHDLLVRRPALLPVMASAPATPVAFAMAHQAVALLVAAGADESVAEAAFSVVFSYVVGAVTVAIADPPAAADQAALRAEARELLGGDDHPYLDSAASLMQDPEDLDRGLDLILAGIRSQLTPSAASGG